MHRWSILAILITAVFMGAVGGGCRSTSDAPGKDGELRGYDTDLPPPPLKLTIQYPPDDAVIPPELPPLTFRWDPVQDDMDKQRIRIVFFKGAPIQVPVFGTTWKPGDKLWDEIKHRSSGTPAMVTVEGFRKTAPKVVAARGSVTVTTSKDPVGAPLFYREVPLPFIDAVKAPSRIRWRFGAIDEPNAPPVVLENLPVCGNCHSFSKDGKILGMDVDYANDKGSYVITETAKNITLDKRDIITWSDFKKEDKQPTFGLLSQVSPSGRYTVSTVKDRSVFVPRDDLAFSQLFFPLKGILAIYDRKTGKMKALPGADDPAYVHSNPTWSPDGKHIVFARAEAYDLQYLKDETTALLSKEECAEFLEGGRTFQFDLYRIPFNNGRGGEAVPIEGASGNGKSNYFAKYSPDGKWLVFCRAKSFMLLQPDAELFIIPAEGGGVRRLAANTERMNSWHSFSPNGKWMVFASKAAGPYTQLYLTHMDAAGKSSPPIILDHMTAPDRAANIPEFVNLPPDAIASIKQAFVDDISYVRTAMENVRAQDFKGAETFFQKALKENPENLDALTTLGGLLTDSGRIDEAIGYLERAVKVAPEDSVAHYNLGNAFAGRGRYEEAVAEWQRTVALDPENLKARNNLGAVLLNLGKLQEAEAALRKTIAIDPKYAEARRNLGDVLFKQKRTDEAIKAWRAAVRLDDRNVAAHKSLGAALASTGRYKEAIHSMETALGLAPNDLPTMLNLASAHEALKDFDSALKVMKKALSVAKTTGQKGLVAMCQRRIEGYSKETGAD